MARTGVRQAKRSNGKRAARSGGNGSSTQAKDGRARDGHGQDGHLEDPALVRLEQALHVAAAGDFGAAPSA